MGFRIARASIVAVLAASVTWAAVAARAAEALPPGVATALDRSKLPRDAFVAMVQEVGAGAVAPRLTWRSEQPVNPASLMKLLTSYAALETLGQAWSWTTPVWLQGPLRDGVLDGNLVIKGSGDPKLVVERVWLLLRRVQQLGVREIRGDIVLDRSAFAVPEQNPADFDGDGLRPYNVGADALMVNYKAIVFTFTPKPDAEPETREGRIAKSFSGSIWVDEVAREVIRIDAKAVDTISFGFGLVARLNEGSTVTLHRQPIENGLWLPTSIRFAGEGRALLLRSIATRCYHQG